MRHACLWLLDDHGRCGTSTSIQHPHQLQQSYPDGSCGWCVLKQLARELCRDSGRLVDLLKLLEGGGQRLKHSLGDPEDRR